MGQPFDDTNFDVMDLPQTSQDYRRLKQAYKVAIKEMGQTVAEPDLTPLIVKLMQNEVSGNDLDEKIVNFFSAYDEAKAK
jgi:hypothetical protein